MLPLFLENTHKKLGRKRFNVCNIFSNSSERNCVCMCIEREWGGGQKGREKETEEVDNYKANTTNNC